MQSANFLYDHAAEPSINAQHLETNADIVQLLNNIPPAEQFLKQLIGVQEEEQVKQIMTPLLLHLHKVIYNILPKPNKGLWEPQLQLDPFLLSYFTLLFHNTQDKNQTSAIELQKSKEDDLEDKNKILSKL